MKKKNEIRELSNRLRTMHLCSLSYSCRPIFTTHCVYFDIDVVVSLSIVTAEITASLAPTNANQINSFRSFYILCQAAASFSLSISLLFLFRWCAFMRLLCAVPEAQIVEPVRTMQILYGWEWEDDDDMGWRMNSAEGQSGIGDAADQPIELSVSIQRIVRSRTWRFTKCTIRNAPFVCRSRHWNSIPASLLMA